MARVRLEEISKSYGKTVAVSALNLEIADGEFVSLVGPSGCGKSTTLRMVAGLEDISSGRLYIGERLANDVSPRDRNVAMVFQSYALFPHMTVAANIGFGLKIQKRAEPERRRKTEWALSLLGLEKLADRLPKQLSGGERQRVALGRALVLQPDVLLLDEPLSNLDAGLRTGMRTALKKLHQKLKNTVIYVTHDQVEAMTLSDRIAILSGGRLMQVGSPRQVYARPRNLFVAGFIGSPPMNQIPVRLKDSEDGIFADAGDFGLPIGGSAERLLPYLNRKAIAGIRPENIKTEVRTAREGGIRASVNVVEPTGAENIVDVNVGETNFKVKVSPDSGVCPGQAIGVEFEAEAVHVFDPDTGDSLLYREAEGS